MEVDLFKPIDDEKTIDNVKRFLSTYYWRWKRTSGEAFESKVTATYSFEPRSYTGQVSKPIEAHVVRKQTAIKEVEVIEEAINSIFDSFARQVIIERYCINRPKTIEEICLDYNYSVETFYLLHDKALLNFADYYKAGELQVYKTEEKEKKVRKNSE